MVIKFFLIQNLRTNLRSGASDKKGIKQDSDPGVFPGVRGINPVSFCLRTENQDSMYFQK